MPGLFEEQQGGRRGWSRERKQQAERSWGGLGRGQTMQEHGGPLPCPTAEWLGSQERNMRRSVMRLCRRAGVAAGRLVPKTAAIMVHRPER